MVKRATFFGKRRKIPCKAIKKARGPLRLWQGEMAGRGHFAHETADRLKKRSLANRNEPTLKQRQKKKNRDATMIAVLPEKKSIRNAWRHPR